MKVPISMNYIHVRIILGVCDRRERPGSVHWEESLFDPHLRPSVLYVMD